MPWLCEADNISLYCLKETGDSAVLFVVATTALYFHCTQAYYFELFDSKQLKYVNCLQKD